MYKRFETCEKLDILWNTYNGRIPIGTDCVSDDAPSHITQINNVQDDLGKTLKGSYVGKEINDKFRAFVKVPLKRYGNSGKVWRVWRTNQSHPTALRKSVNGNYGANNNGNVLKWIHPECKSVIHNPSSTLQPVLYSNDNKIHSDWTLYEKQGIVTTADNYDDENLEISFWAAYLTNCSNSETKSKDNEEQSKNYIVPERGVYKPIDMEAIFFNKRKTLSTLRSKTYNHKDMITALCHSVMALEERIENMKQIQDEHLNEIRELKMCKNWGKPSIDNTI